MAIPVLIIGKSGSGKSTSMRNCVDDPHWNLIKVLEKPLPFRGKIRQCTTDDYTKVMASLASSTATSIVIDDAGYLLTNTFMYGHSNAGSGNAIFSFYNVLADNFWNLIMFIMKLPADKIVYLMMHEEKNDFGDVKAKTIGKMLDEKVCVEGMFTIVLRAVKEGDNYYFVTQSDGGAVSKSPLGMFSELKIDNDLALVDKRIRDYWEMNGGKNGNDENPDK